MQCSRVCNSLHAGLVRDASVEKRAVMDRRWRGSQGQDALSSLEPFHQYKDKLPHLAAGLDCATAADVYSVYSCLHAAGKQTEVACDPIGAFRYLQVLQAPKEGSSETAASAATPQDIVVPVSASYSQLTPVFLSNLLDISPADPPRIVLAIVDGDGTVVLNRMYSGIHAPAEGFTGTDTLGTGKKNKAHRKKG